jgi:hypothetical protein
MEQHGAGPNSYRSRDWPNFSAILEIHPRLFIFKGLFSMKTPFDAAASPRRKQAAEALRRARKLPPGAARNDLRQLAVGLLWLDRNAFPAVSEKQSSSPSPLSSPTAEQSRATID